MAKLRNLRILTALILSFVFILTIPFANALCTVTFDKETYNQAETITATMNCDSAAEKSQTYDLTWSNGTTLETDSGTTPATTGQNFFESYVIPSDYVDGNITATLTGTNLEGSDTANVTNASANDLIISDIEFSDDLFLGLEGSMSFLVKDGDGNLVSNARCNVEFLDGSNRPIFVLEAPRTSSGSSVVSDTIDPGTYKEGVQYSSHIHCSCGTTGTDNVCWDSNGNEITKATGDSVGTFQIDTWLTVNTVTNKDNYIGREEVFICANVTSVDPQTRTPMNIYHQIRCSNRDDNDSDTDRALLTGDDGQPDERGINPNTTQMQCKRFIIPEPPYLQGGTNECYASTRVVLLNNAREEIVTYDTTSDLFNVTVSDLNIFPDWESLGNNSFNTIINLSEDKFSSYNGNGVSNIDLQLSRTYTESIKSEEQYYKHPLRFDSFLDAASIKNITILNESGSVCNYSIEILDDGNIELELKNVDVSPSGWYNVTIQLHNYDERQIKALENYAGASKYQTNTLSNYISNLGIAEKNIIETSLIKLNLTILQNPEYGDYYKINYRFYSNNGLGSLVTEHETEIKTTGTHNIYLLSDSLNPVSVSEDYLVTAIISMQDENGFWLDFAETEVGTLSVSEYLGLTGGRVGFYDVLVDVRKPRYTSLDNVVADITLINTGDLPDEDTVLVYYLTDESGKRFGESKEQILEVPPGKTILTKEIALPDATLLGEWRFNVEYSTVVQPRIDVYDSFRVVEDLHPIKDSKLYLNFIELYNKHTLAISICLILFVLFIFILVLNASKKE